jgi:xanthine dehydrogenase iron-sulfur cluster and FAD-binding subunit A
VQQAFIAKQGAQCGYCLNGMIIRTVALLEHTASPSEREIREALKYNLCRCGAHEEILQSVRYAVALAARPNEAPPGDTPPGDARPSDTPRSAAQPADGRPV